MILRHAKITRFRSIEETHILGSGGLNVLIGKNNAGKSNLLYAIHGFFGVARDGSFLTLRPMFDSPLDHFNQAVEYPIEITCCFSLSPEEMSQLILSIGNDYPQVSNVVTTLSDSRYLKATVKYFYRSSPFGLITAIMFNNSNVVPQDASDRLVYKVEDNVAPQLQQRASQASIKKQNLADHSRVLSTITEDLYSTMRRPRPGASFRTLLDSRWPGTLRPEISDAAEADFQGSDNYPEFQATLRQRLATITSEIDAIERAPIPGDVLTVGGQEHVVPSYITEIARRFAEIKVPISARQTRTDRAARRSAITVPSRAEGR
jgi:putative ATP-dependent endonuclease of OLD family